MTSTTPTVLPPDTAASSVTQLLDQLDAEHAAATPGPWSNPHPFTTLIDAPGGSTNMAIIECDRTSDATAIVAEHNAVPQLTAAIRAVLAKCDAMEKEAPKPQVGGFMANEFRNVITAALAPTEVSE